MPPQAQHHNPTEALSGERSDQGTVPPQVPIGRPAHRLGPLWRMVPLENRLWGRMYAAGLLAGCAVLLYVSATIQPGGADMGTHRQLHLPRCGFVSMTGFPCPSCGMTTAFAYTVRGQWGSAVHAQLVGFLLAVGVFLTGLLSGYTLLSGRRLSLNWYRIEPTRLLWWGSLLFVGAWGLKIGLGLWEGVIPARPF